VTIREALSAQLAAAMRRRDTPVVTALRTALSAAANAEAAQPQETHDNTLISEHFAGDTAGLGATEVARVDLTEEHVGAIVAHERADLLAHAERLTRLCRHDEADAARRAADALGAVLADAQAPRRKGAGGRAGQRPPTRNRSTRHSGGAARSTRGGRGEPRQADGGPPAGP
jgi:hypothetical protein